MTPRRRTAVLALLAGLVCGLIWVYVPVWLLGILSPLISAAVAYPAGVMDGRTGRRGGKVAAFLAEAMADLRAASKTRKGAAR